jgi:hypothetical protein
MSPKPWHLGDKALVEVDIEIFRVAFFKFFVFFVNFVFKVSQTVVQRIHVVFDTRESAMKGIMHLFALELGESLLLGRCQRHTGC